MPGNRTRQSKLGGGEGVLLAVLKEHCGPRLLVWAEPVNSGQLEQKPLSLLVTYIELWPHPLHSSCDQPEGQLQ